MLAAEAQSSERVVAFSTPRSAGPFSCPECGAEVIIKKGKVRIHHFAHRTKSQCAHGDGETDTHRRAKEAIFRMLTRSSGVEDCRIEERCGPNRADVLFLIRGQWVAVEVQRSSLAPADLKARTENYTRLGVAVIWVLTDKFEGRRCRPNHWQKWLHALAFGSVFAWDYGCMVVPIGFAPAYGFKGDGYDRDGTFHPACSYRLKATRCPIRDDSINLTDMVALRRTAWSSRSMDLPAALLWRPSGE
jgi:competence protein CoiA